MSSINKLDNIVENVTSIAHAIIIVYTIYIFQLAVSVEFDLTTLHIIFLSLGVSNNFEIFYTRSTKLFFFEYAVDAFYVRRHHGYIKE